MAGKLRRNLSLDGTVGTKQGILGVTSQVSPAELAKFIEKKRELSRSISCHFLVFFNHEIRIDCRDIKYLFDSVEVITFWDISLPGTQVLVLLRSDATSKCIHVCCSNRKRKVCCFQVVLVDISRNFLFQCGWQVCIRTPSTFWNR